MNAMAGRIVLTEGWALAAGSPGGAAPQPEAFQAITGPMPVAAALEAAGAWSLDGTARDFDRECWWYRCQFDRPADLPGPARMGFDGLATLAQVWLNGTLLLESRSMFRPHEVDVTDHLRGQGNELLIRFDPLHDALAQRRPRPRWRVPMVAHQQLRWWRTTLLGRTPGWSPPAAVVGPWRPVWLAGEANESPRDVRLHASWSAGVGEASIRCQVHGAHSVRLCVTVEGQRHEVALQPPGAEGDGAWQGTLRVPSAPAWWPHTHGKPALHEAHLLVDDHAPWPLGHVGFREVRADTFDAGFGLVVNGEPVFARGVCWVPLDTLRLHTHADHYRAVLTRLRDAGVNLIRVGGTMVYEHEAFYALCDELGVMVWQEFMFANMDYPAEDPDFRQEVDAEFAALWPAWRRHPSVAVVCGNSEVSQQAAMWGAGREHWQPGLFHEVLPALVQRELPGLVYWPSSAHGGAFPFQPNQGTTSFYGVGAYRRSVSDARTSGVRFATESLAFAQVPSDETLARLRPLHGEAPLRVHSPLWKARAPRDLGAGWDFDDVRDHYVQALFGEDPQALRMSDPARHLVLGRAAASEALEAAFSQWRAADSRCRGALVWFLRDLWAGAGWGYLDDRARPKAAFHALARACQSLTVSVVDEGLNGVRVSVVNETAGDMEGELHLALYRDGEHTVASHTQPLRLRARRTECVAATDWLDGFMDVSWAYRFGPPAADVLSARWVGASGASAERVHFIDPGGRGLMRRDLGLTGQAELLAGGDAIAVTVTTRAAARGVHFEVEGWSPADEYFHLAPGGQRTVRFERWEHHPRRPWRATVSAVNAGWPTVVTPPAAT